MANDGSKSSLLEDWIVSEISAHVEALELDDAIDVDVFSGSENHVATMQASEVLRMSSKPSAIRIYAAGSENRQVSGEDFRRVLRFSIVCAVSNQGSDGRYARRGQDATTPGTNLLQDIVFDSVNDKSPADSVPGFERALIGFGRSSWEEAGLWITTGDIAIAGLEGG